MEIKATGGISNSEKVKREIIEELLKLMPELYGTTRWRYRFIKDAETFGVKIQYKQMAEIIKGKTRNADILIAIMMVTAMKRGKFCLNITYKDSIIKTSLS